MGFGAENITSWYPKTLPTSTTISTIDPTNSAGLYETLLEISIRAQTETNVVKLYYLSRQFRGAAASLTIISQQQYLATATATQYFPQITEEMFNATLNLKSLHWESNIYATVLSLPGNGIFAILFLALMIFFSIIFCKSRLRYFGMCMSCASALEFIGYLARFIAHFNWSNKDLFLCQIITLTVAPTFTMAGIYFLLAQFIVLHGRKYSVLRPLWFSFVFLIGDLVSLLVQGGGGIYAAVAISQLQNTRPGTWIMVGGLGFQVGCMTLFLVLYIDFINRLYFRANPTIKFSIRRTFQLLFNTLEGRLLRQELEPYYEPSLAFIRKRSFFYYLPLVILISSIFIYIRCIYRMIELSQGWRGYLITHEGFVLTLDAMMVFLACSLYVPFHPRHIFGKDISISNSLEIPMKKKRLKKMKTEVQLWSSMQAGH
ncbi:uncharacterized protein SPAPADRAFT_69538 [Spathaspora passalidarum NRRL Y-27907]|uniref:Sphingoid long-chain base transporter RSB1 n=1 Tax=Spathaspora passalidarum (strain NRRL Y-27907 / 11-Y1) TaxID=619300 RepID=G3AGA2_SPAPN|nr:uncharacterized protein SPAPADRAFT_69538 [Spathaspora passalidarum NRRL Y-27907]EGW35239.1 hypothetical protein SPAPADRAFT_69538 [Spathaspora passalidarum NRRL Y-27907]